MADQSARAGSSTATKRKYTHQRSRKVCEHCHSRKIKCDVLEKGTPCTNCASYESICIIRRRKNQRRDATPSDDEQSVFRNAKIPNSIISEHKDPGPSETAPSAPTPVFPGQDDAIDTASHSWWEQNSLGQLGAPSSTLNDFSHLIDLDDIFTFTGESSIGQPADFTSLLPQESTNVSMVAPDILRGDDREYLQSQGCFALPPTEAFRHLMILFFKFSHSHLPVIVEDRFWSLWSGNKFCPELCSPLLVRAMMFAAVEYADVDVLADIGFATPRDARALYYRQGKLLLDFGVEEDPVHNAQACLLLCYYSPTSYRNLRINSSWLGHSIRFARIARAESFYRFRESDPERCRLLKRIWWCILFRDRILSLGCRRSLQIDLQPDSIWQAEDSVLQPDDFQSELGNSPVHDMDTQLRIIDLLGAMCRFMQCVQLPLKLLYTHEGIDDKLSIWSKSQPSTIVADIRCCEEALRVWHDETLSKWPFPVHLGGDDTPDPICLYVNMLFSYHAVVTFALNMHLILIHEIVAASPTLDSIEEARESLELANADIARRTQEVLQVRLAKYLPISTTALIASPLILQAINVAAARSQNPRTEAIEVRKLDIFTRTLRSQQRRFDSCDYVLDVLTNIINYVQDDEKLINSVSTWRGERQNAPISRRTSETSELKKVKLDWTDLVYKRPRLFLRLMVHLDHSLCTGFPPSESDFIPELRRGTV